MKITFLGKDVEQPRRLDGKYKGRAVRGVKLAFWVTLLGGLVFVAGQPLFNNWYAGQEMVAHADADPTALAQEMYGKSIDSLKDEVINSLAAGENGDGQALPGYVDDNKAGTLPRKDKVSYGCMAFKISTVQRFSKQLHGSELSNLDAVLVALDCVKAKQLAKEAIFGITGALWEWSAATPEMGVRVSLIREMAK